MNALEEIMEENFLQNLKLEAFARLCARSLSSFKRDFQKQFYTTPGRWLKQRRLHHAMQLLQKSHTVVEAAYESGFENVSHFSRSFRNQFGMPPAAIKTNTAA